MIRKATKFDIPKLLPLIKDYSEEAPIQLFKDTSHHNPEYVTHLLYEIIAVKGFVLVDNDINGMLIAMVLPNIWCPSVLELKELAWWVKPEYRNTTLGGKLWLEFNEHGNRMLDTQKINMVCTTKMVTSPALNYEKRGYQLLETTYFKE